MSAPDIEKSRCAQCGWRRDPQFDANTGHQIGWFCPACHDFEQFEEIK